MLKQFRFPLQFLLALMIVFLLLVQPLRGQSITNLQPYPMPAMNNTPSYLLASTMFSSSGCSLFNYTVTIDYSGVIPAIEVYAFYCMGSLTVICERTDTIPLGTLPAGAYGLTFHAHYTNFTNTNCIGPFGFAVVGDISFIVSEAVMGSIIDLETSFTEQCGVLDTVSIIADLMFPSAPCELQNYTLAFTSPNSAEISVRYCLGPLAVICNKVDTFSVFPMSYTGGDYTFTLVLQDCAGSVIDTQSILFNTFVSLCPFVLPTQPAFTGVSLVNSLGNGNLMFDFSQLPASTPSAIELTIFLSDGRVIAVEKLKSVQEQIQLSLPSGMYFYAVKQNGNLLDRGKAVVY